MNTTPDADLDCDPVDELDQRPGRGTRVFVLVAAALVLVLLGAAGGIFVASAQLQDAGPPSVASVDVGFVQDMRVHHLQAVTMATIARERSTDQEVLSLAFDIEGGQLTQVGMMTGWLNLWSRPLSSESGQHLAWLPADADGHGHDAESGGMTGMPGMATPEEIERLRTLSGPELDVYFLQLMLRHHQGGLPMARYAAERSGVGVVRNLAKKIVSAQNHDNTVMTLMLADRGARPLPPPG